MRALLADLDPPLVLLEELDEARALLGGGPVVDARDVGEHDDDLGVEGAGAEGGEGVVVGEDVGGGVAGVAADGVVLVDDGDDAEAEEALDGVGEVAQALRVLEVALREQDLRRRHLVLPEQARVQVHQLELPRRRARRVVLLLPLLRVVPLVQQVHERLRRGHAQHAAAAPVRVAQLVVHRDRPRSRPRLHLLLVRVQLLQAQRLAALLPQHPLSHPHRAARHEDHLHAVAHQLRDLLRDRSDAGEGYLPVFVREHGRPGLDQHSPGLAQGRSRRGFLQTLGCHLLEFEREVKWMCVCVCVWNGMETFVGSLSPVVSCSFDRSFVRSLTGARFAFWAVRNGWHLTK